ncbi:hypothetical protein J5I95_12170, partial [Candidatus Poribacteria bacterium]|nr:hypothetical protein [Candidatus Poribacteria bacterium]
WGIASLILIIGVVGIYFILQPDPEPEPEKVYNLPSEAELKKAREARKPPPGASPNGHWHNGEWHDESHIDEDMSPVVPFTPPLPDGQSLQARVAASDDVPKYEELKTMSQEELGELMKASYTKAKTFDAEVKKRWDAWGNATIGSDDKKRLKEAFYEILREQFIHESTGRKAFDVFYWRSFLNMQDNPLPNLVITPIPEPFDP